MTLKSYLVPRVAEKLFSRKTLDKKRDKFERLRVKSGAPHLVEFFHDPSDPYSQLLKQVLQSFQTRYDIQLETHVVGPPATDAAPERDKLRDYARLDAAQLAKHAGFDFEFVDIPAAENTAQADARRTKLGHYLGGMLYYGGGWDWGVDRLHYL